MDAIDKVAIFLGGTGAVLAVIGLVGGILSGQGIGVCH